MAKIVIPNRMIDPATGLIKNDLLPVVDIVGSTVTEDPDGTQHADITPKVQSIVNAMALGTGGSASAADIIAVLTANGITVTPPAPISITIDDTANTATIVPPSGYGVSTLESSIDNGSSYQATPTGVRSVTGALASGAFKGRVAAGTNRNAGAVLSSSAAFTEGSGGSGASGTEFITTPGSGTARNDFAAGLGYKFTLSANKSVVSLGRSIILGNSASHTLFITNASGTTLASTTLNTAGKTAGAYAYADLATPLALTAGTPYYIFTSETVGGDQWYDEFSLTATGGTVNNGAYIVSGTITDTFALQNSGFGFPNLKYT